MGWPLIMYLSRAKSVSIWPQFKKAAKSHSLGDIKSSLSLSLNPKLDVMAEWKKTEEAPPPSRDRQFQWPPWESLEIAASLEDLLWRKKAIGTMDQFIAQDFSYPCYKLSGDLVLKESLGDPFSFRGIQLNSHCLTGTLNVTNSETVVSLVLALENIAGIDWRDGEWHVWESGAYFLLDHAQQPEGYPLFGLFTYNGTEPDGKPSCGIVYFASALAHDARDTEAKRLLQGISALPQKRERFP